MQRLAIRLIVFVSLLAVTAAAESPADRTITPTARPFSLADIRLLDGPFRDAQQRTRQYLHDLEAERLLYYFRETAGLPAPGEPMGGWEKTEVRGHTMGHFLSALAQMYAATGDEALKAKAEGIVAELARCQAAHGDGYVSAFPKSFIDRVVECKPVWAPWYTIHKILAGLVDVHVYCDSPQALEVAQGMAGWIDARLKPLDHAAMQRMLNTTEQGGMNEVLANLYGLTGERRWLELSRRFVEDHYVEPLARGEDRLKGEHVNSFIPNIIGTARQYELAGDGRDRQIAAYFWDQVVGHRSFSTGGTSTDEHWRSDPDRLAAELDAHTQETCCTYNMLKLTRHLMSWQPDRRYADFYERALVNSILATQDPETAMMMYFVTLAPGYWKYFNTPRDSFWCCTGTGMENHARYGESIYLHDDSSVWVNLFIASELNWQAKGVRIRQETRFPDEPQSQLTVKAEKPVAFTLRLRVPQWTEGEMTVRINGEAVAVAADATGYLAMKRTWADGDRVEVETPMRLWAWPMPDDPTLVAVMYGPLVLAGKLGGEAVPKELVYTEKNWFEFPAELIGSAPDIVTAKADPAAWIEAVPGETLRFRTKGVGRPRDVELVPYHRLWGERYAVYWRVLPEDQWQKREAERKAREAAEAARQETLRRRLIDRVTPGDPASEKEHALQGEGMAAGRHLNRTWRHAADGWFSYRLKVLPDRPVTVVATYWGSDSGRRTFDLLVDGQKIATQTLANNAPDQFFDVEYPVPEELTRGRQSVTVRFQAPAGAIAGGLFELMTLRKE